MATWEGKVVRHMAAVLQGRGEGYDIATWSPRRSSAPATSSGSCRRSSASPTSRRLFVACSPRRRTTARLDMPFMYGTGSSCMGQAQSRNFSGFATNFYFAHSVVPGYTKVETHTMRIDHMCEST
eukprot:3245732-Prymnesium_polylepis.2